MQKKTKVCKVKQDRNIKRTNGDYFLPEGFDGNIKDFFKIFLKDALKNS